MSGYHGENSDARICVGIILEDSDRVSHVLMEEEEVEEEQEEEEEKEMEEIWLDFSVYYAIYTSLLTL